MSHSHWVSDLLFKCKQILFSILIAVVPKCCQSTQSTAKLFAHKRPPNPSSTFPVRPRAGGGHSTPAKLLGGCQAVEVLFCLGVFPSNVNSRRCFPRDELGWPLWQDNLALTSSSIPLWPERCPADRYSPPLPSISYNWILQGTNNSY